MPDLEAHKSLIRQYAAAFSNGDFATLQTLFTPDAQIQGVMGFGGLDVALPVWRSLHAAFAPQLTIEALIAEANLVAARYIETGTFTAPFRNLQPTGKSFSLTAMEFFLIENGKIARRWGARDSASLFRQLGTLPPQ